MSSGSGSESSGSSFSCVKAWYEKGIYVAFTFDDDTKNGDHHSLELKNMVGKCAVCEGNVKGAFRKSSNFIRHMRDQHTEDFESLMKLQADQKPGSKRKRTQDSASEEPASKRTLFNFLRPPVSKEKQDEIDQTLLEYIIAEARPLRTVSSASFTRYSFTLNARYRPMSEKRLKNLIGVRFIKFYADLKLSWEDVTWICLTADIWTCHKRGFFGVTAHWLDKNLNRKSAAIAIQRFKGSHTYDAIARKLNAIICHYELQGKVVAVVTDNGSNFVKAFQEYRELLEEEGSDVDDDCQFDYADIADVDGEGGGSDEAPVVVADLLDAGNQNEDDDFTYSDADNFTLPPHIRCLSHTLNLVATTDFEKAIAQVPAYLKIHRKVMGKLQGLWNLSGRSVLASDDVYSTLGRYLPKPGKTRWNSLFDALVVFVKQDRPKVDELMAKLKIPSVLPVEHEFILEYLSLMAPIAKALDSLQGETNVFLGSVLPCLTKMKAQIVKLNLKGNGSQAVREILLSLIEKRFGQLFLNDDYIYASITHPKFKLAWLSKDDERRKLYKTNLEMRLGNLASASVATTPLVSPCDDFLASFEDAPMSPLSELERYLSDPDKNVNMLLKYPSIMSLFVRLNTTLPSSAPVERLFSTGSVVLTARRGRLNDILLEHLILLKIAFKL